MAGREPDEAGVERGVILPCPCCGGRAEEQEANMSGYEGGSFIECTHCGLTTSVEFDRKENLYDKWNRRPAIGSGAGRDAVIELRPRDEWHEDFGFALWYDPKRRAYIRRLTDRHWCKLPDVAAPPSVCALAPPEKAASTTPARIPECVTPDGLKARADIMRKRGDESCARHLELAADEIERLTAPPAASDLQERAQKVVSDFCGYMAGDEWHPLIDDIAAEFAAIRAEAYEQYTKDHADLVRVMYAEQAKKVAEAKAEGYSSAIVRVANRLAANRPTGREEG